MVSAFPTLCCINLSIEDDVVTDCFCIHRSAAFHNFVKVSLTKNPKKRPTAEKLLSVSKRFHFCCDTYALERLPVTSWFSAQHVYVAQTGLTRRLAVDLLDKMNNPDNHQHYGEADDDDLEVRYGHTFAHVNET